MAKKYKTKQEKKHNSQKKNQTKINKIGITNDIITGRGGLTLFVKYIEHIKLYIIISKILVFVRITKKSISLQQFIKQMIVYFIDGTHTTIGRFDQLKEDKGYAASIENKKEDMASSHQIKRMFRKFMFNNLTNQIWNKILTELFIWRLKIEKPEYIKLGIDTMVLNNDDALKREGVEPTYKNKKGFQVLHVSWGPYLIKVLFRSGKCHSNHGTDFIRSIGKVVKTIRNRYKDVPIILLGDSGFFDQVPMGYFEEKLKIHYVITGKLLDNIKEHILKTEQLQYQKYKSDKSEWNYIEFYNKLKSWDKYRRCIYTTSNTDENGQLLLEFVRPDALIYTNIIDNNDELTQKLIEKAGEDIVSCQSIIKLTHGRGADELIHRSIKELVTKEQLPFKHMAMNRAYYFLAVISHFLFESYKRDVTSDILPITSYPETFRRIMIDFAAKVIKSGGYVIFKVRDEIYKNLKLEELWYRCHSPVTIC